MKKILFLLAFLTFPIFLNAQGNSARALLDEVSTKIESYNNVYLEFNYNLENKAEKVSQETRGNLTLQKNLYNLKYMGVERIFDGKKVYLIVHEDEEVIISKNDKNDEGSITPSKMFNFYKSGYTIKMDIVQKNNGRDIQFVKLTPIDSNSEIRYILIGVDTQTKHIAKLIEVGNNGTQTSLIVTNFKTNQPISNKLFTFDVAKYKNEKRYLISEIK
ncbi:MAG: outer membrane lipoprotein carrier protein LolA [Bacteroidetes bacterium]|jgi:outer membrane lipoprotein-sorting protein|nr:outer membrane lipoprotein carrier protein LolA [Bacteroidota bacterium]